MFKFIGMLIRLMLYFVLFLFLISMGPVFFCGFLFGILFNIGYENDNKHK